MSSTDVPVKASPTSEDLFAGGGEMGRRMRDFNWAEHPLGPPEGWPQSLRTVVRIMLTSRYAMWLGWGPQLWFFYNDAYKPTLGLKHGWALGTSAGEVWAEVREVLESRAQSVIATGEATWDEGLRLILERSGYPEETFHTFSYSPVPDGHGGNGGMLCVVTEETDRVIGQRRLALLGELATELAKTHTEPEVYDAIRRCFGARSEDVPFAFVYTFESESSEARLACAHTATIGSAIAPAVIPPGDLTLWPVADLLAQPRSIPVDLARHADAVPRGAWDRPAAEAIVVPVFQSGHTRPAGCLVVGLNPYCRYDLNYRGFVDLLAGQISAGLTGARAYEAERRRAAALAELDRAKTEFFSNISHEFRTPLTLMLAPLEDELRERTDNRERLETAHRNSLRLLRLVNTLLDFSRIESGRIHATYVPTDLGRYTADLASAFRSVVEKAGLRFTVDAPPLPEPVHVDREMWEKIVFNLLSNAFKFTFAGEIAVAVRPRGEVVELTVRDTGTGIPVAELPRLFERFHRVHGARSRSHEGTGIGLALVSQLVRLHGGEVRVESTEGHGTTFTVTVRTGTAHLPSEQLARETNANTLPPATAAFVAEAARWVPASAPAPAPRQSEKRAHILLADDNRDMRDYVHRLLVPHYEVTAVEDGEAALASIRQQPPDLLLTDVMMPRLDGFGLLQAVRSDESLKTIPVILLSARAGEEAQLEGIGRNADDYLVKPFTARELLARIQTHLELAQIRREAAERIVDSERRFRHVADHSPLMFWVTDAEGRCTYLNERWYEFTGQTAADALGFGWLNPVHPDDRGPTHEKFTAAVARKAPCRLEYRLRRHDGVYRWMMDRAAPRFSGGRYLGAVGSVVDVTDEREEREEITRNRNQLRLALESGRTGAFDWDMASQRVTWSPELEKLYGLAPGSFGQTYRAWAAHVVPEDVVAVEATIRQCIENKQEDASYEFRAIMPDGSHRWMEGKAKFLFAPNGTPRRMTGINTDIDHRKRAERNAEFLSGLSQEIALLGAPEAIIAAATRAVGEFLGGRCRFLFLDALREHIMVASREAGSAQDSAARYRLLDFGTPELLAEAERGVVRVRDVREDPRTQATADRYVRLGVKAWMLVPFVREGKNAAFLAVADDQPRSWRDDEASLLETVIARVWPLVENARHKQAVEAAEEKIRVSENRLRSAVDAAQLGTWEMNPRTREVLWDERSRELFGITEPADTYQRAIDLIHPDDRDRAVAAIGRAFDPAGNGRYDEEYRVVDASGTRTLRWLRATGRVIFDRGEPTRFSGTLLDVTPLVQARETLAERRDELERLVAERTAELSETVAELEGFSYSISHDLRAPLRAMQSFAQLLVSECSDQITPEGRDYLRRIVNASNRMDRLIHDVLVYSQVARTELQLEPVDLQRLVDGIVESYPQFQSAAADIIVARDLPSVLGNEAALTQCVSNLLGNAVKFVARGVRPRVEITARTEGDRVCLCIADNGIGIAPSAHEKIFGIFERLGRDYEGTGIGLAVVRKAAERMGGSIRVQSELGRGSTFCLELAAAR